MRPRGGLRIDGDVVEGPVLASEAHSVLRPGLKQEVGALLHAGATVGEADAVAGELERAIAAADADDVAATREDVEGGGFLGQAERVMERQDVHGSADVDALGPRGQGGG